MVGSSIDEINHYSRFIDSMEKTIEDVQQKVVQARAKMNWHEQKLLEKTWKYANTKKCAKMTSNNLKKINYV